MNPGRRALGQGRDLASSVVPALPKSRCGLHSSACVPHQAVQRTALARPAGECREPPDSQVAGTTDTPLDRRHSRVLHDRDRARRPQRRPRPGATALARASRRSWCRAVGVDVPVGNDASTAGGIDPTRGRGAWTVRSGCVQHCQPAEVRRDRSGPSAWWRVGRTGCGRRWAEARTSARWAASRPGRACVPRRRNGELGANGGRHAPTHVRGGPPGRESVGRLSRCRLGRGARQIGQGFAVRRHRGCALRVDERASARRGASRPPRTFPSAETSRGAG